ALQRPPHLDRRRRRARRRTGPVSPCSTAHRGLLHHSGRRRQGEGPAVRPTQSRTLRRRAGDRSIRRRALRTDGGRLMVIVPHFIDTDVVVPKVAKALGETLFMVTVSFFFAAIIGLVLGIFL